MDAVARLFLGIIATVCFAGLCGSLLQSGKMGLTAGQREFAQMAVTAVFFQGAVLVWVGFFLREHHLSWSEAFGLEAARQTTAIGLGIVAGGLFLPVALGMQYWLGLLMEHPVAQPAVELLQRPDLPAGEKVFMGVLAVLVAPLAEEAMFRGILYPTVKQSGYPRAAVWVTSVFFGVMHFNLLSFVPLTLFSLLLIYLYERTGSLWAPITAHSLFNFANFLFLMLAGAPVSPLSAQ